MVNSKQTAKVNEKNQKTSNSSNHKSEYIIVAIVSAVTVWQNVKNLGEFKFALVVHVKHACAENQDGALNRTRLNIKVLYLVVD